MKLFWNPASPYARKVRAVAREKRVDGEIVEVEVNTQADPADLIAANPLGKIPALIGPDGQSFYDSPVICAFLDAYGPGDALIPADGPERWAVLGAEALADGVMDLAFGIVMDGRKPDTERSPTTVARWRSQLDRAIGAMGDTVDSLPGTVGLGHIACVCALDYVDFRLRDTDWRADRAGLVAWHQGIAGRPSLVATAPR